MARSYRLYCSVYGCLNSSISNPEISFFKLPPRPARLSEWLQLMCRDDLADKFNITGYRICEKHFNVQDILPTTKRKVLKKNARPSLNLPNLQSTSQKGSIKEDKQTQTESTGKDSHAQTIITLPCSTSKRIKLENELSIGRKKMIDRETENKADKDEKRNFYKLCDKFLTEELSLLVKSQTSYKPYDEIDKNEMDMA